MAKLVPTYIRDSDDLREKLKSLGRLPEGAKLFSVDAVAMYTNINTRHAIESIRKLLKHFEAQLPPDFPAEALLAALDLIMRYNVFQFGDTYWIQNEGAAMGTPVACSYATTSYGLHEIVTLLVRFESELKLFYRFIDDALGCWVDDTEQPNAWDDFLASLPYGTLKWTLEAEGDSVDFLDLTISINEDRCIETKTYQKPMNLYLYIPPHSCHPPGVLRGLVFGALRRYWRQNTRREDYQQVTGLLFDRIIARGWEPKLVWDIFLQAAGRLDEEASGHRKPRPEVDRKRRLFCHREYHPNDLSRREIRQAFDETCNGFVGTKVPIEQLTIAYSGARTLGNMICPSKLRSREGRNVSDLCPK